MVSSGCTAASLLSITINPITPASRRIGTTVWVCEFAIRPGPRPSSWIRCGCPVSTALRMPAWFSGISISLYFCSISSYPS